MKSIVVAFALSFFALNAFADDTNTAAPQGAEPVAPVAEPNVAAAVPAQKAEPAAKREVARKRKHRAKKHRRHHRRH